MFNKEFFIGLSTIFGWTPGLILSLAALFSTITGILSLFNHGWFEGIALILIGVMGILGFIAMSAICWGLNLSLRKKVAFLMCGVISLLVVSATGFSGSVDWFHLNLSWVNFYLYLSPLVVGIIHLVIHVHLYRKAASQGD